MFTIPPGLLEQVDERAAQLSTSRSGLIRQALKHFLEEQRRQELRALLKEGYLASAERDLRICDEFAYADYEAIVQHVPSYDYNEGME
jgi:CopG family transcriptional regulator/antitoxin EndoAI